MKNYQFVVYPVLLLFFIAFRPVDSSAQIDMGVSGLVTPVQKNCFGNAEAVTIRIKNYSTATHNFATAPVTVNVNVTGPNATNFAPVVVNTGTLPAGDSLNVSISSNYNMAVTGSYIFNGATTVTGDVNSANNSMPATSLSVATQVAGVINPNPTAFCGGGGTPTLTLNGSSGGTIQWQESASATGPWVNVGSNSITYTPTSAIAATRYYRAYRGCTGNADTAAVTSVTVSSPQLLSSTPATRCGPGTVSLNATASTGASVRWTNASQGGTILGTGNSFTTPNLTATTSFYASSWIAGGNSDVGIKVSDFALCGLPTSSTAVDQALRFTTNKAIVLNTAWIIPSTTSVTVALRAFNSTVNLASQAFSFTSAQLGNPQQINLNWSVAVPGNYQLTNASGGIWNIPTLGCGYPFVAPGGSMTIYGSAISSVSFTQTSFYNGFYGINFTEGCQSTPVPVVATVNDNTAITQQPQASVSTCAGAIINLSVVTQGVNLVYQWRKNGSNIQNSNNDTLTISPAMTTDAGNYDVIITGGCGSPVTSGVSVVNIASGNAWLGNVSSDWNNSANWCAGVPTSGSNVTIFSGTPFQPAINSGTVDVRSLVISSGAAMTMSSGTTLNVYGDLVNSGTFSAANTSVNFKGAISQIVSNVTVGNAVVNGAGISLNGPMIVNQLLTLTSGNLALNSNNLTVTGSITGTAASHIVTNGSGFVISKNITTTPVTVPVGPSEASYNPVIINNGGGKDYSVRVATGISPAIANPGLAVNRTWQITPGSAPGAPVNISFEYTDADMNTPAVATNNMEIGVHNGTSWNIVAPSVVPSGSSSARHVVINASQFGPMAVANIGGISWITATSATLDPSVSSVKLLPNPVQNAALLSIVTNRESKSHWDVINADGIVIMSFERSISQGQNNIPVQFGNLSSGIYILKGTTEKGQLKIVRFTKL